MEEQILKRYHAVASSGGDELCNFELKATCIAAAHNEASKVVEDRFSPAAYSLKIYSREVK